MYKSLKGHRVTVRLELIPVITGLDNQTNIHIT